MSRPEVVKRISYTQEAIGRFHIGAEAHALDAARLGQSGDEQLDRSGGHQKNFEEWKVAVPLQIISEGLVGGVLLLFVLPHRERVPLDELVRRYKLLR